MKNQTHNPYLLNVWIYILATNLLFSCSSSKWIVPPEYAGQWKSESIRITVRTKAKQEPFKFTSDTAIITLLINTNKTASGSVGTAAFENVVLKKNQSLPWETGVEYIVECGTIGKIFSRDPLEAKEVEIWIGPIDEKGNINAELRYTQGSAVFPMAGMVLSKEQK
jgi:hypothetical protein